MYLAIIESILCTYISNHVTALFFENLLTLNRSNKTLLLRFILYVVLFIIRYIWSDTLTRIVFILHKETNTLYILQSGTETRN